MPGNEVGDRIHNFFGQESVSQGQQHSHVVDGSWPGLSINPWAGSQAQLGFSQFSNIKNHNLQQSADTERGHGGQSSSEQHGVSLSQSLLRPEFSINQSHSHGPTLNGYAHEHQVFQRRQNEGNALGMDMEFDQRNRISQGFSIPDSRLETVPELNGANCVSSTEAMVNYDFFGGQQQMSSQHHGMLQPLSQQQLGINGMHLSTEQAILKRMQEIQMHQQLQKQHLQQQEVRQLNSVNHLSSYLKQTAGGQSSPLINGIPVLGATNYSSQPEDMMANKNWPQHVASPVACGSSGLMHPQQVQQPRSLGLFPQHPNQSLYGLPVSGTTVTSDRQSPSQRDRTMVQQLSSSNTSFHVNQYNGKMDHISMQNGSFLSKQGYQGQNMIGTTNHQGGQDLNNVYSQEMNATEYRTQDDLVGPSETSRVKTNMEVTPPGNVATLDPTEEKILFGSDDNLWGAFGRETNMSSGLLDGNDFGAFPSMQSGSWSALMQSAVAETSSTENGPQEGCGFHSSETPAENWQKLMLNDSGKRQSTLVDNMRPTVPTMNSRVNPGLSDSNPGINLGTNFPGVGQSAKSSSATQLDRLQSETNHNYIQHFTRDGTNKWIDRNPKKAVAEDGHVLGKANEELNAKNQSFSWKDQQSMSPFNDGSQLGNRPNGWNFINHVSPSNLVAKNRGNEHLPHSLKNNDHKSSMVGALGYGGIQNMDSISDLNSELEHAKPDVDSAVNHKGDKVTGNFRSEMVKIQRSFESVGNNSSENAQLDTFNSRTLPVGKSKSSSNSVRRKFQYHPMGDVDVEEEPHGSRLVASPFSQGLKARGQGFNRHSNSPTHPTRNSVETDKGFPGFLEDRRGTERIPCKSISSNSSTSTSAPFDRSAGSNPNRGVASSQNMLELLHKVDEAGEHANAAHIMPSDLNQTYELPEEETSDGSVHLRQNHSSTPQGYGLQLAPPSQLSSFSLPHIASGSSLQKINSLDTAGDSPGLGVKGSPVQFSHQSREISQGQPRSTVSLSQGRPGNDAQRNYFAVNSPNFLSSRSKGKNQNMHERSGGVLTGQYKGETDEPVMASKNPTVQSNVSHSDTTSSAEKPQFNGKNQDYSRDTNQQFPVLEAVPFLQNSSLPSTSQEVATSKLSHKVWTDVSIKDHSYGALAFKDPSDVFKYNVPTTSKAETFPSQPQRPVGENAQRGAYVSKDSANCFVGNEVAERSTTSQVKGISHFQPGASPLTPSSAQKEMEALGRSLRANTVMPEKYSLQQQVQAIKSIGIDPDKSNLQRFKSPDGDLGSHPLANHGEKQVSEQKNATDNVAQSAADKNNLPPQDTRDLAYNAASLPQEQPQVSPQMASSWFNQFGTFKNGQIAPLGDTGKTANIKPTKLPATVQKPSDSPLSHDLTNQGTAIAADASQNNNILNRFSTHATENPGSLQLLHPETAIGPKKRKTLASEFVPWREKVMDGSSGLEDISMAEANWARVTNRLTEKVEDDYEVVEAGSPALRSKRRLVLTTQLMQLLLNPPPVSVRSADAKSQYENVAYFVARSTLGDACSTLSCSGSDAPMPYEDGDISLMNSQACNRIRDEYLSKVMEDFINRARKVESDLLRLDKGASLVDLRLECQELEKYSVINRFAKFHSRGQADAAESSSTNDSTSKAKRSGQERYAVMIPIPKNLPDGVQCLSL